MSEAELGAYCRQKGLYPKQVQRWKEACLQKVLVCKKGKRKPLRNSSAMPVKPSKS
jgi:hypothetical protein